MFNSCDKTERTRAYADFEAEWRRVTGGEHPTWPSRFDPLVAETLNIGGGPPLRWKATLAAAALKTFPRLYALDDAHLKVVLTTLASAGASADVEDDINLSAACEELTQILREGATHAELVAIAQGLGIEPCRLRITVR